MQTVRGYFDQVFEGSYSKQLPPAKQSAIEANADDKYVEETGKQQVDRNFQLWKSLRNVEVLKYDRSVNTSLRIKAQS